MTNSRTRRLGAPAVAAILLAPLLLAATFDGGGFEAPSASSSTPAPSLPLSLESVQSTDTTPSLGTYNSGDLGDFYWKKDLAISNVDLSGARATGGDGTLVYSFDPALPTGLTLNQATLVLSGTPTAQAARAVYTLEVTDDDGDTDTDDVFEARVYVHRFPTLIPIIFSGPDDLNSGYLTFTEDRDIGDLVFPAINTKVWNCDPWKTLFLALTTCSEPDAADVPTFTYDIPNLPDGLTFDSATRTLSGAPTTAAPRTMFYYTATEPDGDEGRTYVYITVLENLTPTFPDDISVNKNFGDIEVRAGDGRITRRLPIATGGNGKLTYTIEPDLPDNGYLSVVFDNTGGEDPYRVLVWRAKEAVPTTTYTIKATDEDGSVASIVFTITVHEDSTPTFAANASIMDQEFTKGVTIDPLQLPVATGGDGGLSYQLLRWVGDPETGDTASNAVHMPPGGLRLNQSTLLLTGTPTETVNRYYMYVVHDSDADNRPEDQDRLWFRITITEPPVLPAQPTGLVATAGKQQVTLAWDDPDDDSITGYEHQQKTGTGNFSDWAAIDGADADTTSHTFEGLTNNVAYGFKIRAKNADGDGPESAAVTATPSGQATGNQAPAAPTNVRAAASSGEVALTWDNPDDDSITGYEYQQKTGTGAFSDWAAIDGADADTTSHTFEGLTNNVAYGFKVRAKNADGDGPESAAVTATPQAAAALSFTGSVPDQNCTAGVRITPMQLPLATGGGGSVGYALYPTSPPPGVTHDTTQQTWTGTPTEESADHATTYIWTATDGAGAEIRTTFEVSVLTSPEAPMFLVANPGAGAATLEWWMGPVGGSVSAAAVTGFEYQQKAATGSFGDWQPITGSDMNTTTHTVSGLTAGTEYTFKVRAMNPAGNGAESPEAATTPRKRLPAPANPVPENIGHFAAQAGDASVTLTWIHGGSAEGWMYRLTTADDAPADSSELWGHWQAMTTTDRPNSVTRTAVEGQSDKFGYSYQIRSLQVGVQYWIEIVALDGVADAEAYSGVKGSVPGVVSHPTAVTPTGPIIPTPTGLAAAAGDGRVTLSWDAAPPGTQVIAYDYRFRPTGADEWNGWYGIGPTARDSRSYVVEFLTNGTEYDFQIRLVTPLGVGESAEGAEEINAQLAAAWGHSDPSESAAATPLGPPKYPKGLTIVAGELQVTIGWADPDPADGSITSWQYQQVDLVSGTTGGWTTIDGGAAARTVTITGLVAGTAYKYTIRAVNAAGTGEPSDPVVTYIQ